MLTWGQGINRFCINSIIQSQPPYSQPPNYFYLGSDLKSSIFYTVSFLWRKSLGPQNFGSRMTSRFPTFCCLRHFSYFSDSAVLFLGAAERLKYQPAAGHSALSECRGGNVWWFPITRLRGLRLLPEGAASARRRWHSSCANSLGVPFVNRQSPYKAGRQQKGWYFILIPLLFSPKHQKTQRN